MSLLLAKEATISILEDMKGTLERGEALISLEEIADMILKDIGYEKLLDDSVRLSWTEHTEDMGGKYDIQRETKEAKRIAELEAELAELKKK